MKQASAARARHLEGRQPGQQLVAEWELIPEREATAAIPVEQRQKSQEKAQTDLLVEPVASALRAQAAVLRPFWVPKSTTEPS